MALGLLAGACGFATLDAKAQDATGAADPFAPGTLIDFREQMRNFVQSISAYGRSVNPRFVIIARDGLDLVAKPDPEDDQRLFPARAYIRAIDGVMETGLLDDTVTTPEGKFDPVRDAAVKRRNANLNIARAQGLPVFALEFATEPDAIDKAYADAAKKGLVPFVAVDKVLGAIPDRPASAYSANPKSVSSVAEARNYLYLANSLGFGSTREFTQALRATNHDIVVIDVFHAGKPVSRQDVEWLKYKRLGAKRLVLAQIDISSAAAFNYYWQPGWGTGNPPFISTPVRDDPDRYRTLYWNPAWQAIIAGDFNSYVYGVIDLGFDGVVLKGVDGWRYFDSGGEEG